MTASNWEVWQNNLKKKLYVDRRVWIYGSSTRKLTHYFLAAPDSRHNRKKKFLKKGRKQAVFNEITTNLTTHKSLIQQNSNCYVRALHRRFTFTCSCCAAGGGFGLFNTVKSHINLIPSTFHARRWQMRWNNRVTIKPLEQSYDIVSLRRNKNESPGASHYCEPRPDC